MCDQGQYTVILKTASNSGAVYENLHVRKMVLRRLLFVQAGGLLEECQPFAARKLVLAGHSCSVFRLMEAIGAHEHKST